MNLNVLALDLETTGLKPEFNSILEVACAVVRPDTSLGDTFSEAIFHPMERVLAECDAWCTETHTKSGLLVAVEASPYTLEQVDERLYEFVRRNFPDGKVELLGNSVHFDKGFIDRHMPRTASLLSHQLQDVSGAARMLRRFTSKEIGRPSGYVTHRAMADVLYSVDQLRAIVLGVER